MSATSPSRVHEERAAHVHVCGTVVVHVVPFTLTRMAGSKPTTPTLPMGSEVGRVAPVADRTPSSSART